MPKQKEEAPDDVELASYQQLKRIADALERLLEEVALSSAAMSSMADNGVVVYQGQAQP